MRLLKRIFLVNVYLLYVFLCLLIADKIYSKYENFPFEHCTVILQKWKPVGFRASNIPGLIYEMVPNLKMKDIETNSMGIRGKEYETPKPKNTFRVLILGDSVAYGSDLDQREIFSTLLEEKLNNNQNKIQYEVINTSVSGYNTMQEYIAFVNKYYIYEPDLLLVCFCNNDMTPAFVQEADQRGIVYGYLRHKFNNTKPGYAVENITPYEMLSISMPNMFHLPIFIHRRLILISSIYRGITIRVYDFLSKRNPYKYPHQGYFNIVRDQTEYAIESMKNYCRDHSIDLIFVLFPPLYDDIPEGRHDYINDVKKILDNNSITYIDLKPYFKSYVDNLIKLALYPTQEDYCHLNVRGHKLTAEVLYDYLVEYLKIKKKNNFAERLKFD